MRSLFKLVLGAAIAGALFNLLMKSRGRAGSASDQDIHDDQRRAETFPTVLVADESSVGEGSGDDRVQLPDDGRIPQGPPNS